MVVMESTSELNPFFSFSGRHAARAPAQCHGRPQPPESQNRCLRPRFAAATRHFGPDPGLVIPPEPIRELWELTQRRAIAARDRTREIQRLEKFLEGSGGKLSPSLSRS